jgi:UDP-N-acetylglucosamine 2-epimerase (non-hydrolysing)/GDP/UDP-N,N'-diacetylbacillosamine 2-epimerase (hydrolysing)
MRRKICVVTGARSEYGLLYRVMREILDDPELELQIIATGMHLSPEFGLTYRVIEQDGFRINEKVEMLLSSDTPVGIAKSIGLGVIGFADALERLRPGLLILLGDRFEILAAAQAALVAKIPVAHIAGGDLTEGAFDDAMRHAITKMSHLHFVTNEISGDRVRQLGENPDHIYNVGNPGLDQIKRLRLLERQELEKELDFSFKKRNLLVTFHPVTLEYEATAEQFQSLLDALDHLGPEFGLIFTKPNSDVGGRLIGQMIDSFVANHFNARAYVSLGQLLYFSTIACVDAVLGNSSSGLYEAPSFKKPTVNIGDRQKGRLQPVSVINCQPRTANIEAAIQEALQMDCSLVSNPYGDGDSSSRIVSVIKRISDYESLLKKHFFEV